MPGLRFNILFLMWRLSCCCLFTSTSTYFICTNYEQQSQGESQTGGNDRQARYARRFRKRIWKWKLNSPFIQQELTDSTERPNKNGNQTHNLYALSHCCWAYAHLPSASTLRGFVLSSAFFFMSYVVAWVLRQVLLLLRKCCY